MKDLPPGRQTRPHHPGCVTGNRHARRDRESDTRLNGPDTFGEAGRSGAGRRFAREQFRGAHLKPGTCGNSGQLGSAQCHTIEAEAKTIDSANAR